MGIPQLEQNFAPGAFGAWQLAQLAPPAFPAGPGPGPDADPEPGFAPGIGLATPNPATIPPKPIPTPSAATPLPPPAAAPSPTPFKAVPTPYSRKPPASRVYAVSLRKPLRVCSSSGLRLMVTLPSRVTFKPYGARGAWTSATSAASISAVRAAMPRTGHFSAVSLRTTLVRKALRICSRAQSVINSLEACRVPTKFKIMAAGSLTIIAYSP